MHMAGRILWSLEEAVIMLDFLLKNLNGELERKDAISAASKELRERAVKHGIEIDDVFRNINGITLQMSSMEYIYTDGKHGLEKPVKVFSKAVELYKENKPEYLRLLKEARGVPEQKSVQDGFMIAETSTHKEKIEDCSPREASSSISNKIQGIIVETKAEEKHESGPEAVRTVLNQKIERENFNVWMQESGLSNATAKCYVSALNSLSVYLSNKAGKRISVYEEDNDRLRDLRDLISNDLEMKKLNDQSHKQISAAINKLLMYRTGVVIKSTANKANNTIDGNESIPKIELPEFSKMESNLDQDIDAERLEKILKEHFSEGLLPNALRLDKFRMYFEEEYGYEPSSDDNQLLNQLKRAGTLMDRRIYPKQNEKQNSLTVEILTNIINTLNNGARCIYFDCVLEKWRMELANQLNVYNVETLKALLIAQGVSGLVMTDYVLKATGRKVYPEENVVELMEANHSFMNYEQLNEILWFLPIDVIKHALVTTPSIVNVDAETYFYAPNFPASPEELQQIKLLMNNKLDEKGYLVAPDIFSIIHSNCQTVAINTTGYKDWAYRNIFKYIFRDDFDFGSSVISKKGNALEMWQVYRGYCREHERITLEDLKQLKDELGVPIYWETVRNEMVRININELVRNDLVHFDVDAIDAVLDEMCPGDYLPLKDITMFLHFPSIEYPWNSFVLESYLTISKKFCLYHASYANHGAFGVMVRRDSKFNDYKSVVVDMLSKSDQWINTKQALELIVDKGYQARKKWVGFDTVTQEAKLIRERILEEGK